MLLQRTVLGAIAAGRVSLAFRLWRRPTVKAGGTLRTAVGVLAIEAVERIPRRRITERDAKRAGFASRDALLKNLDASRNGDLYRIALRFAGPDPGERLRARTTLNRAEWSTLKRRLDLLDGTTPWTCRALKWIAGHPGTAASQLASSLGRDVLKMKAAVRKLKELGLTESLAPKPGYRISRRGAVVLKRLNRDG